MPLRAIFGTPIIARPIVLGAGKLLSVPYFRQQQNNWCWAACFQTILLSSGVPTTQRTIVKDVMGTVINEKVTVEQLMHAFNSRGLALSPVSLALLRLYRSPDFGYHAGKGVTLPPYLPWREPV